MKTTRKQALKIYNIAKWINPYGVCDLDKEDHIKAIMELDFEENIKELNTYISETHDDVKDLLNDKILLKKYLNLVGGSNNELSN